MNRKILKILTVNILAAAVLGFRPIDSNAYGEVLKGKNRFDTAVKISQKMRESKNVILVNGKTYVDALSASSLANITNSPVLLINRDTIPDSVMSEIKRINPSSVIIIGGKNSISPSVQNKLEKMYMVDRISGSDRYKTSEIVIEKVIRNGNVTSVAVASNEFDIVSASSLPEKGTPILLIPSKRVETSLFDAHPELEVSVIGGENSVPSHIYRKLNAVERISGSDRYRTSMMLARKSSNKTAILAGGETVIDALTAGPFACKTKGDIILVPRNGFEKDDAEYIKRKYRKIYSIGGIENFERNSGTKNGAHDKGEKNIPYATPSFKKWDSINHYDRRVIMSPEEINIQNKRIISESKYLNDIYLSRSNFAIINRRTVMKSKPDNSLNRQLALSAVFPGDYVAILKTGVDGKWSYIESVDYRGWVPSYSLTPIDREKLSEILKKDFITCISRQVKTLEGHIIDMGSRLILEGETEDSYIAAIPKPGKTYKTENIKVSKKDFIKGYLPFSQANVVMQALKFEGEPYGWGHSDNARDCSGFVRDVYRSFGIVMARDAKTQAEDVMGRTVSFKGAGSQKAREVKLKTLKPGNTLYMKGHVFMYLGLDSNNRPMIIHQYGSAYKNGRMVDVYKNEINDAGLRLDSKRTFLETVYLAKDFYN